MWFLMEMLWSHSSDSHDVVINIIVIIIYDKASPTKLNEQEALVLSPVLSHARHGG